MECCYKASAIEDTHSKYKIRKYKFQDKEFLNSKKLYLKNFLAIRKHLVILKFKRDRKQFSYNKKIFHNKKMTYFICKFGVCIYQTYRPDYY